MRFIITKISKPRMPNIQSVKENILTVASLAGLISGMVLGVILKNTSEGPWIRRDIMYVRFIGELFLNMLKSVIIPLIIPSLISSIGRVVYCIMCYNMDG